MSRAFVLLHHERRHAERNLSEPREIPIQDSSDSVSKPLVTTTARVIIWALIVITAAVGLNGWILSNRFETIIDSRFDRFELRLAQQYALKSEAVTRTEYELRHGELNQTDKLINDRIAEQERRLEALNARVTQLERKH